MDTKIENKYYTPEIEELYVGFECEHTSNMSAFENSITDRIYKEELNITDLNHYLIWSLEEGGLEKFIRVKYLDKEDIESLGFKQSENDEYWYDYKNDRYWLYKESKDDWRWIISDEESEVSFAGNIKNKSELKKLLKQFNINE